MNVVGPEILIVLLVVVVLFGGAKLPKLARSLGSAKGEFEKGLKDGEKVTNAAEVRVEPKAIEIPVDDTGTLGSVEPAKTKGETTT